MYKTLYMDIFNFAAHGTKAAEAWKKKTSKCSCIKKEM